MTKTLLTHLGQQLALRAMAEEAAARHRIPEATVTHPKGVIVPGDEFMTEKIRDPNYVPYCGPCMPMRRMRRVEDGFVCPTCGCKSNWDLTKFNNNVDVKFDSVLAENVPFEEGPVVYVRKGEEVKLPDPRDWAGDRGKKNTSVHTCGQCAQPFFGKRSRKYCALCQQPLTQQLKLTAKTRNQSPFSMGNRHERRHRY